MNISERNSKMTKLFYIQKTGVHVGNSMLWWQSGDCGYTADVKEARLFTKDEADSICCRPNSDKRKWPQEYIDARNQHHIDSQDCSYDEARDWKGARQ